MVSILIYTDSKEKAEILSTQFKSVFTPSISGKKYSAINKLNISLNGVTKLLQNINVSKASGPDHIPGKLLNELSNEIAQVLHTIFVQFINEGVTPSDWRLAYVTPIFKKENQWRNQGSRAPSPKYLCNYGPPQVKGPL